MKIWTKQAKERLAEYLDSRLRREGLVGDDANELREDLSAHVHEELERCESETIGTADLELVLGSLEDGAAVVGEKLAAPERWR